MTIDSVTVAQSAPASRRTVPQTESADAFAAKQMDTMRDIIAGKNAAQQAFIASHPDTRQSFEGVINSLFAAGSSHANEAARIAATVQDMRTAQQAYRDNMG